MSVVTLFFSLLRYEIGGEPLPELSLTENDRRRLDTLAKQQGLSHLTADALVKNGLTDETETKNCLQQQAGSMLRYESAVYEIGQICACLEEAAAPHILLKGAVIRRYYPEPWMRTGGDVDLLVKPADFDRAADLLCRRLHYRRGEGTPHDILLIAPTQTRVELHRILIEPGRLPQADGLLTEETVWRHTVPAKGEYSKEMDGEMLLFYHYAHMAKHLLGGGIGVRFFLDLFLLERQMPAARAGCDALLEQGGLSDFAALSRRLADRWFGGDTADRPEEEAVRLYEDFVLHAGLFGSEPGKAGLHMAQKGKRSYWSYRLFPPKQYLTSSYPVLRDKPWLTPAVHLYRLASAPFRGGLRRAKRETAAKNRVTEQRAQNTALLLDALKLK